MYFLRPSNRSLQTMIGQAKISSFFTSASTKRPLSSCNENAAVAKKPKQAEPKDTTEKEFSSPEKSENALNTQLSLTPEQKERIEASKKAAIARLQEKNQSCNTNSTVESSIVVNVGPSWHRALSPEFSKQYFTELSTFVEAERKKGTVYPPPDQVFTWTQMCDIKDVKVVMLGQDPYHGPKQAHGLCFSVQQGIRPPPSLENMFKELSNDVEGFKHPGHGVLTGWARQGVLLLNACLTVRAHQANSHAGKGWELFTDAVISWLNKNCSGIVFMLWGSYAQKKGACIDKKKHNILKAVHPSPLSAHRGFFGCKHFSECNKLLKQGGKTPIDWNKLPPE